MLKNAIRGRFRSFGDYLDRLERMWVWIPVIWRSNDYDYAYTLEILALKLRGQSRHLAKHRAFKDWYKQSRQIRSVADALDRLRLDDYDSQEMKRGRGFMARASKRRLADWEFAFNVMRDDMRSWWD